MPIYAAYTGANPTTAARAVVACTTSLKTLLQVATPSTCPIRPIAYGISFDLSAAAVPGTVELIEVDVAATVTTLTPEKYSDPGSAASLCVGGTSATGFNASAEGSIGSSRTADLQHIAPTTQYVYEWVLNREFIVARSKFLRLRTDMTSAVNAHAWVRWEEW